MGGAYGVGKRQYEYHRQPRANTNAIISREHDVMSSSKAWVECTKRQIKTMTQVHQTEQQQPALITTFCKGCEGKMILSPISWLFIVIRTPPRIIREGGCPYHDKQPRDWTENHLTFAPLAKGCDRVWLLVLGLMYLCRGLHHFICCFVSYP